MFNKFKKLLAMLPVLGVVAFGVGCADYDDDINDLQTQIDGLKTGSIAQIEAQLASLSTEVNSLQSARETLESGLSGLQSSVSGLQSSVSGLQSSVSKLESLQSEVEALKSRISTIESTFVSKDYLSTTLSSYATTASVAQSVQELRSALNEAKTELSEAITAAQTEAVATADKAAEEKLAAAKKELETKISELESALETKIAEAQTAAVKSAGEACATAFQGKFDAAVSAAQLVDNDALETAIKDYDAKIKAYIAEAITKNNGEISQKIGEQIRTAVDGSQKLIVGRLTSLKLIPDTYENGIETIELNALTYQTWRNVAPAEATRETNPTHNGANVTSNADKVKTVKYHVSPANVTTEGIGSVKFWLQTAATRASVSAEDLFEITGFAVNTNTDGLKTLDVDLKKKMNANLSAGADKIYTVALEATIADNLCVDGETGAKVYSDYAKLSENTITPRIAQLTKNRDGVYAFGSGHQHFSATYADAKTSTAIQAYYNEPLDMLAFTSACYGTSSHVEFNKEACETVGLYFEYNVVKEPWLVGSTNTDQQMHAKVSDDHFLIAQAPAAGNTFAEKSQTAVGKTPVVRVLLRDSRNNDAIVDVRYFRVEWVAKDVEDKNLGVVKTFNYTLDCDGFNEHNTFTWEDMSRQVLTQIGETDEEGKPQGISRDDFVQLYEVPTIVTEDKVHYWETEVKCPVSLSNRTIGNVANAYSAVTDAQEVSGTVPVELVYNYGNLSSDDGAFKWYLTARQIGSIMDEAGYTDHNNSWTWPGRPVKRTVTITCESKNKHLRGDVTFQFEVIIKLPLEPTISPMEGRTWKDSNYEELMFTPVILGTVNRTGSTVTTADNPDYDWDVQNSFRDIDTTTAGYQIVGDLNKYNCFRWDIQFCHKQPDAYHVYSNPDDTKRFEVAASQVGYELLANSNNDVVAKFEYNAAMGTRWYQANVDTENQIHLTINHATSKGIAMVENEHKMNFDVWSQINKYNYHLVKGYAVQVVKPLTINPETVDGFEDGFLGTQTLNIAEAVTMKDFMGWTVSNSTVYIPGTSYTQADLFKYYKITKMEFDLSNAYVDVSGNRRSVDEYFGKDAVQVETDKLTVPGCTLTNLTYDKKISTIQTTTVYIVIDVTVTHYWGKVKATVRIPVVPVVPGAGA